MPHEKIITVRFKEANWFGMLLGSIALALIAIALDQGVRLDWFNSPLITVSLLAAAAHPGGFLEPAALGRTLFAVPLIDHQRAFLEWLVDEIRADPVDAVLICGDADTTCRFHCVQLT